MYCQKFLNMYKNHSYYSLFNGVSALVHTMCTASYSLFNGVSALVHTMCTASYSLFNGVSALVHTMCNASYSLFNGVSALVHTVPCVLPQGSLEQLPVVVRERLGSTVYP
jgi:predicted thioredoxin/glutaredoxin